MLCGCQRDKTKNQDYRSYKKKNISNKQNYGNCELYFKFQFNWDHISDLKNRYTARTDCNCNNSNNNFIKRPGEDRQRDNTVHKILPF